MAKSSYKPMRDRVFAELGGVADNLQAQRLTAPSDEHRIAFSAALVAVLGAQIAVKRARSEATIEKHLLILRSTLQTLEGVMQRMYGGADECIARAMTITLH